MNVTVKRSQWLRGEADSYLLRRSDNRMCCLGFVCKEMGAKDEDIASIGCPSSVRNDDIIYNWPDRAFGQGRGMLMTVTSRMMQINDDRVKDDATREQQLVALGHDIGINLTFVN